MEKEFKEIFKSGSRTYHTSSIFFPKEVKEDVFRLYAFVRVADNFVDDIPQDEEGFHTFVAKYHSALEGRASGDIVIDSFVALMKKRGFQRSWVEAFLESMAMDLTKSTYSTLDETLHYIYGSAEVIGLFMARIMELPEESYDAARMLGRSMQYINFLRDIDEDLSLGRTYIPLEGSGLESLDPVHTMARLDTFNSFIRGELERYLAWQKEAEEGFHYIPRRYRIPIKTASDMYNWTARRIMKDPSIVYRKKMKPSVPRIVGKIIVNAVAGA